MPLQPGRFVDNTCTQKRIHDKYLDATKDETYDAPNQLTVPALFTKRPLPSCHHSIKTREVVNTKFRRSRASRPQENSDFSYGVEDLQSFVIP